MARKPKTQPIPETTPARRGRKHGVAAPSSALPLAADVGNPAPGDAGSGVPQADPTKALGRRGPGRKPKQAAGAETAPAVPDVIEDETPTAAAVSQAEAAADSDPVQPDLEPGRSAGEAAPSFPEAGVSAPAGPAAHWDRTTDRVLFDWPAIEGTAAQDGPNQGMAKLLVAARAEGARSRWPF